MYNQPHNLAHSSNGSILVSVYSPETRNISRGQRRDQNPISPFPARPVGRGKILGFSDVVVKVKMKSRHDFFKINFRQTSPESLRSPFPFGHHTALSPLALKTRMRTF